MARIWILAALVACTSEKAPTPDEPGAPDEDGDSFTTETDCDDTDPAVNPRAVDRFNDGLDADCDGDDGTVLESSEWSATLPSDNGWAFGVVCDLNQDGTDDLGLTEVTSGGGFRMEVFLGPIGGGRLDLQPDHELTAFGTGGLTTEEVVCGDFDGDGTPDVAVAQDSVDGDLDGALRIWHAPANGPRVQEEDVATTFTIPRTDAEDLYLRLQSGDLDGDGADELVVCDIESFGDPTQSTLSILPGQPRVAGTSELAAEGVDYGPCWGSSVVPDLDGDGNDELYHAVNLDGAITYEWYSNPGAPLDPANAWASSTTPLFLPVSADFDGDGLVDDLVGTGTTSVIAIPDAQAAYTGGGSITDGAGVVSNAGGTSLLAHDDFDGDGADDLVAFKTGNNGRVEVYILSGAAVMASDGGFGPVKSLHLRHPDALYWRVLPSGDIDGDGTLDVVGIIRDSEESALFVLYTGSIR